jgi:ATP-binding cassette subfamily B multidrug efflux pump
MSIRGSTTSSSNRAPIGGPMMGGPGRRGPMRRHGPMAMMRGEKARDFRGTMRKLIQYLGSYRIPILIVMLFAVGSTVFSIVGPKILGKATTKLFEGVMAQITGAGAGIDFGYIGRILLTALMLYLGSALFGYVQGWIMAGISTNIAYRFRQDIAA